VLGLLLSTLSLGCYSPISATVGTKSSLQAQSPQNLGQKLPISAYAIANNRKFELEVARTPQQQATGLMSRTSLANNRGMLFLFSPPQPIKFWMKNTLIPLDIIFLLNGKVQAIAANVPPCKTATCPTYGPDTQVDRVVELRGGTAKEIRLKVGDRIQIEFLDRQSQ
jgi:hypothetical protein